MSLERVWRISKLISNPLQTQMISFFRVFFLYCFFFHVCSNDLGVGLEIIQTLSKPAPNSYVFIFSVVIFFSIYILFWTRGMSLEWVWRFSKLAPNSYVFSVSLEKRNEFGVSLEILQTLPKLAPSSYFFYISSFLGEKRNEFGVSLEIFQTLSKLISNPLQTQMISFFRVFFLYCFFFHVCSNDLGVGLEIIQTLSKPAPNSYVFIFSVVIFFSIYILFWTRGMSLECSPKLIF